MGIATAGTANLGEALLQESAFHNLMSGKVEEIFNLYDHYGGLIERAEQDAGGLLINMVGGPDNVAGLFDISNYNLTQWISDYLDETVGTYYTQRWYIARRDQGSVALCDYFPPLPMTTAFSMVVNGHALPLRMQDSTQTHRKGNRHCPTQNVMQDGRETRLISSTDRMMDTTTV